MFCWKTFQNEDVCAETISHEHLSNAYWYSKIILKDSYLVNRLHSILIKRFAGIILEYKPHPKFHQEHEYLRNAGLVVNNLIFYDNQIIGQLTCEI